MTQLNRRELLVSAAGTAAAAVSAPVLGQSLKKVKFTLNWVPEGSNLWAYVARNRGLWRKRGYDVEVSRGSGSSAATQALAQGQFDIGYAVTSVMILQKSRGLDLQSVGQLTYRNTAGVLVLQDSPIKTPKDLEGKTVGVTPTSGEVPFLPLFAENAGVDLSKVKIVNMNSEVRYRALIEKQIDAMTDFGASSIPPLMSKGVPVRSMLFANYGMTMYEASLMARPSVIRDRPEMVQAIVDGTLEAVAWSLLNPAEAIDIFLKEVPEAGMAASARDNIRLGLGIFQYCALAEEARRNGFGWIDPKSFGAMNDLVETYVAKSGKKPAVEDLVTNRFVGRIRLTDDEWARAKKGNEEFAKLFA